MLMLLPKIKKYPNKHAIKAEVIVSNSTNGDDDNDMSVLALIAFNKFIDP